MGAEFPMAAVTEPGGCGYTPKAAFGPHGIFAVAWRSYVGDATSVRTAVFAARFSLPPGN
jgi:hypothetical protein